MRNFDELSLPQKMTRTGLFVFGSLLLVTGCSSQSDQEPEPSDLELPQPHFNPAASISPEAIQLEVNLSEQR